MDFQTRVNKFRKMIAPYNNWDEEGFRTLEDRVKRGYYNPSNFKSALRVIIKEYIDFGYPSDDHHYNFLFTLEHVNILIGPESLMETLAKLLFTDDRDQKAITEFMAEYFYPIPSDDSYIHYLPKLSGILYFGLPSGFFKNKDFDSKYKLLIKKWVEQILLLLKALIYENYYPFNEPDKDVYIESIFELLCEEFKKSTSVKESVIEVLYTLDQDLGLDMVTTLFQSFPEEFKQMFHEIQKRYEEEYFLIHGTNRPPKNLPI